MAIGDLIEVTWLDAAFSLEDIPCLLRMHTVGWVVSHDDRAVVIAGECSPDDHYNRSMTCIPMSSILSIQSLHGDND